jgi:hypothetical protein
VVWFKLQNGRPYFVEGDVFESKDHMRKCPDSFWTPAEDINPSDIAGVEVISAYNRKVYAELMKSLNIA